MSMMALVICTSACDDAIAIMAAALERLDVEGVHTNRALLAQILAHPRFRAADVTTTWLEEAFG